MYICVWRGYTNFNEISHTCGIIKVCTDMSQSCQICDLIWGGACAPPPTLGKNPGTLFFYKNTLNFSEPRLFLTSTWFFSNFMPSPPTNTKTALNCISEWKLSFCTVKYIVGRIFLELTKSFPNSLHEIRGCHKWWKVTELNYRKKITFFYHNFFIRIF